MSIFKKFAAPLAAVALVAVMGVSLLANTGTAHAAAVTATPTSLLTGTVWSNTAAASILPESAVLTEPSAAAWAGADTITLTHTGITTSACTTTGPVTSCTGGAGSTVIVISAGVTAGVDTITITGITAVVAANGAETTFPITLPGAVSAGSFNSSRIALGSSTSTTVPAAINKVPPTYPADSNAAGGALCVWAADANGTGAAAFPVTISVSLGVVSTGTAKSTGVLTSGTFTACTNYRGGGGIAATDTAIASNSSNNAVSTLSINLTAPTGTTASKLVIQAPTNLAVSPTLSNVTPGYISPTIGTNFAVQVQDSAGLGVNNQVILITVDKGALVSGFAGACAGATSKALTVTSAAGALTAGGTAVGGVVQATYCGNQNDAPGQATITAQNISTSMANVTSTVSTANRPGKVTATYANGVVSATVTDANGNKVADGTPVQFTISANAGAVSNTCTTTTNGAASSAVSLNSGSGTVIVTANYNETGVAATCAAAGAQSVSTVVNIGTVVTPPPTGGTTGPGTFASTPVYSAAPNRQAAAVFNGGTVAQLEAAVTAAGGAGVWAQTSTGAFVLDIVGGPTFVNAPFMTAFPNGFAGVTAVTIIGK